MIAANPEETSIELLEKIIMKRLLASESGTKASLCGALATMGGMSRVYETRLRRRAACGFLQAVAPLLATSRPNRSVLTRNGAIA